KPQEDRLRGTGGERSGVPEAQGHGGRDRLSSGGPGYGGGGILLRALRPGGGRGGDGTPLRLAGRPDQSAPPDRLARAHVVAVPDDAVLEVCSLSHARAREKYAALY